MDRLNFVLDEFTRIQWVSKRAETLWAPIISNMSNFYQRLEKEAVLQGIKSATIQHCYTADFAHAAGEWLQQNKLMLPLEKVNDSAIYQSSAKTFDPLQPWSFKVVIANPNIAIKLAAAHEAKDNGVMGELLGYPSCCIDFFRKYWVDENWVDTTLPMALDWKGGFVHPVNNILLRWLGLRLVSHLPCSFTCKHTRTIGNNMVQLAYNSGMENDIQQMIDILSWPLEWSSLHGIAFITTPIFKIITRSDALPEKTTVRLQGNKYPKEGASGNRFPFKRNLWTDNGFMSEEAMDKAHRVILKLADIIKPRSVIDFGCGNSWLLYKLQQEHNCDIFGIDSDVEKHPNWVGSIYDYQFEKDFSLAIIASNRLNEEPKRWESLLERIKKHCQYLIVYSYNGQIYNRDPVTVLAEEHDDTNFAILIETSNDRTQSVVQVRH